MRLLALVALLLSWFIHYASAAKSLSYCKCTCGKSSAIVPLTEEVLANPAKPCGDCTRIFCLTKSGLDTCPPLDDTNSDILVMQSCFQRESKKDEVIVIGFIIITGGLLIYAMVVRPLKEKRRMRQEQAYNSLPSESSYR